MAKPNALVVLVLIVLAVALVGGFLGVTPLATVGGLPSGISGGQVYDQPACSEGFGDGNCPIISFAWSGSLVSPNNAAGIWEANSHLTITTSCGLIGLYSSNIPVVSGQGGKPDAEYAPANAPAGYVGYLVSSGTVYLESGQYTSTDGCGPYNGTTMTTTTQTTMQSTGTTGFPGFGFPGGAFGGLSVYVLGAIVLALGALYMAKKKRLI